MARKKSRKKKATDPSDGKAHVRRSISKNRQARYEYELTDTWEAGIVLTGSEVKSCRRGEAELPEAFVRVEKGEAWLLGCRIAPYKNAGYAQHEPLAKRKLLLHRREILKMFRAVKLKGLTLVPTEIYFLGSKIKVEIRLGKGKKLHDKRETVKNRDADRKARTASDV